MAVGLGGFYIWPRARGFVEHTYSQALSMVEPGEERLVRKGVGQTTSSLVPPHPHSMGYYRRAVRSPRKFCTGRCRTFTHE